jgi:hypothetical protein
VVWDRTAKKDDFFGSTPGSSSIVDVVTPVDASRNEYGRDNDDNDNDNDEVHGDDPWD